MVEKREMKTDRMTYRWLWSCLIAGGLLLAGCTDRSEDDTPHQGYTPEPGIPLKLGAVTRTDGATTYTGSQGIQVYLSTGDNNVTTGTFTGNTISGSTLNVKEESQYYLYGYMPSTILATPATPTAPTGGYSEGINLEFNKLPAITTDDICIVVGVQRVKEPSGTADLKDYEGYYGFISGINNQNYVNLLMAHLYTGLEVKFMLDPDYAKLRTIRLKSVTLNYTYGDNKVNATVNIQKNSQTGKGKVTPTLTKASTSDAAQTFSLLAESDDKVKLDKNTTTSTTAVSLKQAFCAHCVYTDNTEITITSVYDVFDNKDKEYKNPLGGTSRTSVNKLNLTWSDAAPGKKKTVLLTVMPTYLYILSDNDLDNPIISLSSE